MKPDRASLDAAIPHILSAPKDKAPIEMLCNLGTVMFDMFDYIKLVGLFIIIH